MALVLFPEINGECEAGVDLAAPQMGMSLFVEAFFIRRKAV